MLPSSTSYLYYSFFAASLLVLPGAQADRTNRTIDDTNGDSDSGKVPIYNPSEAWAGLDCTGCAIRPDRSLVFDRTLTAATYNPDMDSMDVTFSFTGTDIWVYFVLANDQGNGVTTSTDCNFTLDGKLAGHFQHAPTNSTALEYNTLVFAANGLKQQSHDLIISTSGIQENQWVAFDRAIYTFDSDAASSSSGTTSGSSPTNTSNPSTDSNNKTGPIVGGVIGGLVGLAGIALALFFFMKRRRQKRNTYNIEIDGDDPKPPHGMSSPFERYGSQPMAQSQTIVPLTANYASDSDFSHPDSTTPYASTAYRPPNAHQGNMYVMNPDSPGYSARTESERPSTDDMTHRPPGAAPPSTIAASSTGSTLEDEAELRRKRQRALQDQMRTIQAELSALSAQQAGQPRFEASSGAGRESSELRDLKGQISTMRGQLKALATSQQSAWAQGLSNEPPPGYTPAPENATSSLAEPLPVRREKSPMGGQGTRMFVVSHD
ncbi:hypothetical protein CYLTODRAFT_392047 [Cylindrobasidium torrendii FP15055 ss-10]|uniref:Epidermal growth factor receptor-like transmembrane-juxtamembrane segment domain-containing protein n=1 Tax=Cylindrobasidium torrendii FP15055 ss-10 TaxID=1314674 RepID=A0A0D7BLF3_9AGAR|nr:hypothetical protein CYLTODRAFT_392047 [Cylindrobasidium torrendii FP15055 ss-10]